VALGAFSKLNLKVRADKRKRIDKILFINGLSTTGSNTKQKPNIKELRSATHLEKFSNKNLG
jgi:hypothetical protein